MYFLYTLLKVVSHYDLSVLSITACQWWVSKKESFDRGVGGWGELYSIFWGFFNFANHHTQYYVCDKLFYNGYDSA